MIFPVQTDNGRYRHFGYKLGKYFHCGHDFDCNLNEIVRSVANGTVLFSSQNVSGFGGWRPSKKGGCIIIQHEYGKNKFVALYGHIETDLLQGEKVIAGEKIGKVHQYVSDGLKLPHLHFCINILMGIPKSKWGYVKKLKENGWIDPIKFIKGMRIAG